MSETRKLIDAARTSAAELRLHGREPVRVRFHPEDITTLELGLGVEYPGVCPEDMSGRVVGSSLFGYEIAVGEVLRGMPVAEWESGAA